MTDSIPRLAPLGDGALTLSYGTVVAPDRAARTLHHLGCLRRAGLPGVIEIVPGYLTVTIHYDAAKVLFPAVRDAVAVALAGIGEAPPPPPGPLIEIPVVYDGPDLEEVAERTGLTVKAVVARHLGPTYRVAMLGFVPGFAYLGPLDPALVLPRRAPPRTRVPTGSVAIAGEQTGIYPAATPGGWHLIGRTETTMFDPTRHPPCPLAVGDRVQFVAQR